MVGRRKAPLRARFAQICAHFAIGLGLAATIAWVAVLGWLLLKAARLIL
jgi:hypothetical protein